MKYENYTIKNLSQKYIDFLDRIWDDPKYESWSATTTALVEKFKITADYADAVIVAYINH